MAYRADVLATQPRLHDFSDILDGYLLQGSQPNPRSPTEQPAADKLAGAEAIDHFAPPDADTLWLDDPYTPVQARQNPLSLQCRDLARVRSARGDSCHALDKQS